MLRQPPANSTGLLGTQVKGHVLLLAVCLTKSGLLCLGDHSQDLCNREPHHLAAQPILNHKNISQRRNRNEGRVHLVNEIVNMT